MNNFQPHAEWVEILNRVQQVFPGAVIAGGALRDTINNRPVKDVDIFIPISTHEPLETVYEDIWDMFAGENIVLDCHSVYGLKTKEDQDRDIFAIFKLKTDNWNYDLIVCAQHACSIHTFDINLCQVAFDGTELKYTMDFKLACENKELKIMNINRTDRNAKRLQRLQEKYPDFTVIQ